MVLIPPALHSAQPTETVAITDEGEFETTEQTGFDVFWLAAAKTPQDLERADDGVLERAAPGRPKMARAVQLRFLALSEEEDRLYKGVMSNTVMWMTHHGMDHDLTTAEVKQAWDAYASVNRRFAEYVVDHANDGAIVQVHDFHLGLCGRYVKELARRRKKKIDVVGFWHIPFAETDQLLKGLRETEASHPRTRQFLEAIASVPMGFHRDQWVQRFCAAHNAVLGRSPASPSFVMPAYVDVDILRNEALGREVEEAMGQIRGELADRNGGRPFKGKIIGSVGRADPKNGMDRLLDAYEILLDDPEISEKPALVLNVSPTRLDSEVYRAHWEYLLDSKARIEDKHRRAKILLRYNLDRRGQPMGKRRADAVATFRIADVVAVLSRAGGRDIVGQEAVALKVLSEGDGPSVNVLSAEAGTSDTMAGIVAEESRPVAWGPIGEVIERAVKGTGYKPGAIVVEGIGPRVKDDEAARRCAKALKQALLMESEEVSERFAIMEELLLLEDPDIWYGELMTRAQGPGGDMRKPEGGILRRAAWASSDPPIAIDGKARRDS